MSSPDTTKSITLADLGEWLVERRENCLRIAAGKHDQEEANGWHEDALYFDAAAMVVRWAKAHRQQRNLNVA